MPTVAASASDSGKLEAAKPKPRTVTVPVRQGRAPFAARLLPFWRSHSCHLPSHQATNVTETDQPCAGMCEPADREPPGNALMPDESITDAPGQGLDRT